MSEEHKTTSRRPRFLVLLTILAALAVVAAACADDKDEASNDDGESQESETGSDTESASVSPGAPEIPAECETVEDSPGLADVEERGEPTGESAEGVAAGESKELAEGDGDGVISGGTIGIHYSIFNASDGSVLDSSWALGGPQQGAIDALPPSFAGGLEGMKVGGRRAIAMPASELYGAEPPPESGVSADDTLVIVIDLVSVSEEAAAGAGADPDAVAAAEERGAPEMAVPDGTEDTEELVVIDEVVGEGAVVCPGDQVVAHYTGIQASNGEEFDSSWEGGDPAPFGLDQVIQGWGEGLVGMQVGGRRTLVIPADLAYGDDESSGSPTGTLVFTIDLVGAG